MEVDLEEFRYSPERALRLAEEILGMCEAEYTSNEKIRSAFHYAQEAIRTALDEITA